MFGVIPKPLWEKVKPADERNRVAMDMNSLLIRDADHVVVVETGAGSKLPAKQREIFGIETPRLLDELKARGVGPAQVTLVVNTHLHFDHSGGNTYRDGEKIVPTFPRASYVFQRLEWEDAMHANERTRGSYLPDDYAPLEAVGKLELIDESVEIIPGVRLDRVQGHTRGTQTVRVSDRGETLFFSSDFMPDRHHLPLPWISAFDLFPLETLAADLHGAVAASDVPRARELRERWTDETTRRKLRPSDPLWQRVAPMLDWLHREERIHADTLAAKKLILRRAIDERWIVGFTHDLPRLGRISESDAKYRFDEVAD